MPNDTQVCILFVLLCIGCDAAVKQQQAEDARRAASIAELKQIGASMHEEQERQSSSAGTPDAAAQGVEVPKQDESLPPSAAGSPDSVDDSPNSPAPTE